VSVPTDRRYTKDHEWVRVDGDTATIGVTDFAANQLGDVVFVDLPKAGTSVEQFATFGVVESVKAVSDLYAPLSGEVLEINGDLGSNPELVNSDPFGEGWMMKVKVADAAQVGELLDAAGYEQLTAEG
jgi:glycine cleavage system H protein